MTSDAKDLRDGLHPFSLSGGLRFTLSNPTKYLGHLSSSYPLNGYMCVQNLDTLVYSFST